MECLITNGVKQYNDLPNYYFNYRVLKIEQNDNTYRFEIRTNVVIMTEQTTDLLFFISTIHTPMIDIEYEINDKVGFIYNYIKNQNQQQLKII